MLIFHFFQITGNRIVTSSNIVSSGPHRFTKLLRNSNCVDDSA